MRLPAVCLVAVTGYGQDADKVRAAARQKTATHKRQLPGQYCHRSNHSALPPGYPRSGRLQFHLGVSVCGSARHIGRFIICWKTSR
jgi:hypothetical protein